MNDIITRAERLAECEKAIRHSWSETAQALRTIRDDKLYLEHFETFEEYCRVRWDYSRPRAYQIINAAATAELLSTRVDIAPENDSQVRPLAKLEPDEQVRAWQEAVRTAPKSEDGQPLITRKHVEGVVLKLSPDQAKRPTREPPTQREVTFRAIRKVFEEIASLELDGKSAAEEYRFEDFGAAGEAAMDWMIDFAGTRRGRCEIGIRLKSGGYYHPSLTDIELWRKTYPRIDVMSELRKCATWNDANPDKRKTQKGVARHINSWLSRASDRAVQNGGAADENAGRHVAL